MRNANVSDQLLTINPATDNIVPRPVRSTSGKTSKYQSYITAAIVGEYFIANVPYNFPDVSPLMANVTVSYEEFLRTHQEGGISNQEHWFETSWMPWMVHIAISDEEYLRQNPKWSKAKVGPDKERWFAADEKESSQMLDPPNCKMVEVPDGLAGVPLGEKVLPIKLVCKIKNGEEYKMRWCVLGNLDTYGGNCHFLNFVSFENPVSCDFLVAANFVQIGVLLCCSSRCFSLALSF